MLSPCLPSTLPHQVDPTGDMIPGCCPEGITSFCNSTAQLAAQRGSCNALLSDTPYRVSFYTNTTGSYGNTKLLFDISQVGPVTPVLNSDCLNTDLAVLQLYIDPLAMGAVTSVMLGNQQLTYAIKLDGSQTPFFEIPMGLLPSVGGRLEVDLSSKWTPSQVCSLKVGDNSVCRYVMEGMWTGSHFMCCSVGDARVADAGLPLVRLLWPDGQPKTPYGR